ncbi:hypothetical protein DYB25_000658 [Aphanomyces astaci]|uniref:BRCT domain-containing protein n=1 Tax=Aphanomyces astaci TaxID=112090 RepID=A0A397AH43_APHAT|nr:hypothetical protein DYB25_000658 [Aphanomyces astaci]RHY59232.1 hypothetical protein DYB34_000689 [Aphanomyces astaci]
MDNDDDGDDTLADTVAGTDAGSQNTPSQWKKHFAEQVPPLQVASPPRALPLCTYDEDETQILFCSNYSITLRFHVMAMLMCCHDVDQMQLAEVELPLVPHENYVGDGDSSNESEDLWTIGDSTLDQPHPTFDGPVDGAIPNAASTTEASDPPPSISGVRIVLTGLDPAPLMHQVGAAFEQDVTRGTHLVAPSNQLKRTVKMLCGISTCLHILDEKWLGASAKLGRPAPEVPYCLLDLAKQAQWSFELKATMYDHTNRHLLLRGRVFYIVRHKSILPAPSDLAKIIECAGGEVLSTSTKPVDNVIVIASAEALAVKSVQKQLGPLADATKYTTELVLSGVLQQCLDLTTTHVVVEHTSSQQQPTIQRRKR